MVSGAVPKAGRRAGRVGVSDPVGVGFRSSGGVRRREPSAAVAAGGASILATADRLAAFAKSQRSRIARRGAEANWLATMARLRAAELAASRQALGAVEALAEAGNASTTRSAAAELLDEGAVVGEDRGNVDEAVGEARALRSLARSVAQAARDAGPGAAGARADVALVREELELLRAESGARQAKLDAEEAVAYRELRECWPSALAEEAARDMPEAHRAQAADAADALERLLHEFPTASDDARAAVGAAFAAFFEDAARRAREEEAEEQEGADVTGGWPAAEHAAFVRVHADVVADVGAKGEGAILDTLARRFPARPRADLAAHAEWVVARRKRRWRRRANADATRARRARLVAAARDTLAASRDAAAANVERSAALLVQEEKARRLRADLEAMRFERDAEELLAEAAAAPARERREARERAARERADADAENRAAALAAHRRAAAQQEAAEAERAAGERAELRLRRAAEHVENAERVEARREETDRRDAAAQAERARRQRELDERDARLAALRATVEPDVRRDPERVLRGTEASKGPEDDPELVGVVEMYKMRGYTTEQLMRNPAFKLQLALRDAGVHDNAYAREVVAAAARPSRPDMLSTEQRRVHM